MTFTVPLKVLYFTICAGKNFKHEGHKIEMYDRGEQVNSPFKEERFGQV